MNNVKHAGQTGKGFYAALSLSVAMVGAGCWYAFTAADRHSLPRTAKPEQSMAELLPLTTAPQSTVTTTQTTAAAPETVSSAEEAEEAAALLRHTAASSDAVTTTVTAVTTAAAEQPVPPVTGEIVQSFSSGELVKSPTTGIWATHNGADFAAAVGSEVCAVLDGTVTEIVRDPLWGICVTLLHDGGTVTRYCGLNENLDVIAGQILERGTVLGTLGDTNEAESASEAHLHFEVLQNGCYTDPAAFFASAQ